MPENIVVFQSNDKISFLNTKVSWSEILIQQNSKQIFNFKKLGEALMKLYCEVKIYFSLLLFVVPKTGCKAQWHNGSLHDC